MVNIFHTNGNFLKRFATGGTRPSVGLRDSRRNWKLNAWSLVLEYLTLPDSTGAHFASVRFLSEHAPSEWLEPSREFALYEGEPKGR